MNVLIIAEIGINHHGDMDVAKMMIDRSKECGADIAKFQSYDPVSILGADNLFLAEAKKAQFSKAQHRDLKQYCDRVGIEYGCSVFHPEDVKFFEDIGLKRYKIASRSASNKRLLDHIADTRKPVIFSTGMCSADDIGYACRVFGENLSLLYCVSKYPTQLEDVNLDALELLKPYSRSVGFSSHCPYISPTIASVCRGGKITENHVVLQGYETGCDAPSSIDFRAFGAMVKSIRELERVL